MIIDEMRFITKAGDILIPINNKWSSIRSNYTFDSSPSGEPLKSVGNPVKGTLWHKPMISKDDIHPMTISIRKIEYRVLLKTTNTSDKNTALDLIWVDKNPQFIQILPKINKMILEHINIQKKISHRFTENLQYYSVMPIKLVNSLLGFN
jgi:hypothetical protein